MTDSKRLSPSGLRPDGAGNSSRLNRAILLCNVGVLLVNFFLAFKTTDVQMGLMNSYGTAGARVVRGREPSDAAMPYSRVLQTLDNVAPGQDSLFTSDRLEAIYDAIRRYQAAIANGIEGLRYAERGQDLRAAYADLDKDARSEVEIALGRRFSDAALVQRLATEVIRSCR
ncbi:MAG TPA: hypothetical protein VFX78_02190 [Candidatus Eisenbacteria bacterium]|nr:hypothetical protein [Candidatus Eisenbacteria bacterium]